MTKVNAYRANGWRLEGWRFVPWRLAIGYIVAGPLWALLGTLHCVAVHFWFADMMFAYAVTSHIIFAFLWAVWESAQIRGTRTQCLITNLAERLESDRSLLVAPPAYRLMRVASFIFPSRHVARVFEPIVADHCEEWTEAEARREIWHARWIHVRCHVCLLQAMGLQSALSALKSIIEFWRTG